jgi:membrane protease YdiL (CAAX protease family)
MTSIPTSYTWFACTSAAIGATEELLFRGVIFYMLKKRNIFLTVIVSSLAHAGYKTLLFASPFVHQPIDLVKLFSYTFIAGLVLGSMRIFSGSTGPPLAAHVFWDIIVYGDSPEAPWWIW